MTIDVAAFVGPYPYRELPDTDPASLLRAMDRVGIDEAWVGYLPSILHADPAPGNARLVDLLEPHRARLHPVPTVHPDLPGWTEDLERARDAGAPAVRAYPMHLGIDPAGPETTDLVRAAGRMGLPVVLTVRLEDVRQRVPADRTPDLPAAALRSLARSGPAVRLVVTHAGRETIEEVHFGLTGEEAARVCWDVSWLWGPPADDFARVVAGVGVARLVFGTGMPLRLAEATPAKLDLEDLNAADRHAIERGNLSGWLPR